MIVIFGGTGTLGHALVKAIYPCSEQIVVVSRCELKQKQMASKFPNIRYVLGDIRDNHWKREIPLGKKDTVYNLAAIKHVDTGESNIEYCVDVNINGTANTLNWAVTHGAKYVFSSTDKAVLPVNVYGASKMIAERHVLSKDGYVFRWGNIVGSRGSVLGILKKTLIEERKAYITDIDMTRFWALIEDVARFMVKTVTFKKPGIHIPEMRSAPLVSLVEAVAECLGIDDYQIQVSGIRPGEKIHEVLMSSHAYCIRSDDKELYYKKDDLLRIVRKALDDC